MKKITLHFFLLFFVTVAVAQTYTTPNTGVTYTLADLVAISGGAVVGADDAFGLNQNLVISENDTLIISEENLTLFVDPGFLITVFGTFTVNGQDLVILSSDANATFQGFRFEEGSNISIENCIISRSGGLRVLTENFFLNNCQLILNGSGATTSAVIQLSRGMPQITNNIISFNENSAIGSAANAAVSGLIFNNFIEGNNTNNANRPQINMGTTLVGDALEIIDNTIIGDVNNPQAGGIAIANFVGGAINVVIDGNTIQNNRYGITILGSVNGALISNNIIEDNNIQGDPFLGGSGINLNAASSENEVIVTGNFIRRNLWGITLQDQAAVNLGDASINPGGNVFADNQNNGQVYALFNNTPNTIQAQNNCWIEGAVSTAAEVEDVISHIVDDPALGEVIFEPFLCGVLGIEENEFENFSFYPNPSDGEINFNNTFGFSEVKVYGIAGNLIKREALQNGFTSLDMNLTSGMYFVMFVSENTSITRKLIIQ